MGHEFGYGDDSLFMIDRRTCTEVYVDDVARFVCYSSARFQCILHLHHTFTTFVRVRRLHDVDGPAKRQLLYAKPIGTS